MERHTLWPVQSPRLLFSHGGLSLFSLSSQAFSWYKTLSILSEFSGNQFCILNLLNCTTSSSGFKMMLIHIKWQAYQKTYWSYGQKSCVLHSIFHKGAAPRLELFISPSFLCCCCSSLLMAGYESLRIFKSAHGVDRTRSMLKRPQQIVKNWWFIFLCFISTNP